MGGCMKMGSLYENGKSKTIKVANVDTHKHTHKYNYRPWGWVSRAEALAADGLSGGDRLYIVSTEVNKHYAVNSP